MENMRYIRSVMEAKAIPERSKLAPGFSLFLISFLCLYFELIVIRWLSSEIRIFAYLKNLPLIASFLGLGLGCVHVQGRRNFFKYFPFSIGILCGVIAFSSQLGITFLPFPIGDYLIVGDVAGGFDYSTIYNKLLALAKFQIVVFLIFGMCVYVFVALGQKLGGLLGQLPALTAYAINIGGSLAGVLAFTAISFAGLSPSAWFFIGFALMLPLMESKKTAGTLFAITLLTVTAVPQRARWSPYYRIDVSPIYAEEGNPQSALVGHNLNVNHDYHQRMLDLSDGSLETPFTAKARPYYNLPYRFVKPERVLVVGAGSGNDVASALRHGAKQVDAVEIDPLILQLGRQLHPERPYSADRVRIINNDARAFFRQSQGKYDLIVFGLLDSQTLLSTMSSIRLDNYIYTLESLKEVRHHLRDGGTVCLSFALVEGWIQERFYRILTDTFGREPLCLGTPYDAGISYLVGPTANREYIRGQADLEMMVINESIPKTQIPLPTDDWPFLYLKSKSIPFAYWFTLSFIFVISAFWIKRNLSTSNGPFNFYMFLLGVGFMLIEVKSISDLSLLFGSTWMVNSVVISAILLMILLANFVVIKLRPRSMNWAYLGLACSLIFSYFLKPDTLVGLGFHSKSMLGGVISGLPLFFAGILFATAFKNEKDIPPAFGANLLGALVGGVMENLCMVYGIAFLNLLALGIYILSFFALCKPEWMSLKSSKIFARG
jgi:SAM-dependent methyltransferase